MLEIRRIQNFLCKQFGWNTPRMFRLIGMIVRLGYYAGYRAAQQQRAADFATPCENCGTVGPHDCDEPEERRITQIG